jgi:hypothetical protein
MKLFSGFPYGPPGVDANPDAEVGAEESLRAAPTSLPPVPGQRRPARKKS